MRLLLRNMEMNIGINGKELKLATKIFSPSYICVCMVWDTALCRSESMVEYMICAQSSLCYMILHQ